MLGFNPVPDLDEIAHARLYLLREHDCRLHLQDAEIEAGLTQADVNGQLTAPLTRLTSSAAG